MNGLLQDMFADCTTLVCDKIQGGEEEEGGKKGRKGVVGENERKGVEEGERE